MKPISYRYKIPLSLVVSALLTALTLGVAISYETYRNIVADRTAEGERMIYALSPALTQALKHENIWLAYTLLRGPSELQPGKGMRASTLVVLDREGHVFVSNEPRKFRIGKTLEQIPGIYRQLFDNIRNHTTLQPHQLLLADQLVLANGLYSEGSFNGLFVVAYPVQSFWYRFLQIVSHGAWVLLLVLLPLTLIGWFWGRRMVDPLVQLSHCMVKVRTGDIEKLRCQIPQGQDEIGELARRFQQLLMDLREKQMLEQKLIGQERMAAIGRLAASVAHEINNPVGGMLVALDTWREHGSADGSPAKLLDLIERGLNQVKDTVSALLVESRGEFRPFAAHDIDDVKTLLLAHPSPPGSKFHWDAPLDSEVDVPATAVRQILLNLLTNALQAIGPGEEVFVQVRHDGEGLRIEISDTGEPIARENLSLLFEPFQSRREGGTGLGLWITYQIVEQLCGDIEVVSNTGLTSFKVFLPAAPLSPAEEVRDAAII